MGSTSSAGGAPARPMTPRQQELIRFLQSLPADRRHVVTIVLRGSEPWEIETVIERRKVGDLTPRDPP